MGCDGLKWERGWDREEGREGELGVCEERWVWPWALSGGRSTVILCCFLCMVVRREGIVALAPWGCETNYRMGVGMIMTSRSSNDLFNDGY